MYAKKKKNPRLSILSILLAVIIAVFCVKMGEIQLVNSEKYASNGSKTTTISAPIKAARGEILDSLGRPIAVNREGFNIIFNSAYIKKDTINDTIIRLVELFNESDTEWTDALPITKNQPYGFEGTENQISAMKNRLLLNHYATAENCVDEMIARYSLEGLDPKFQRAIMGIRLTMEQMDFSLTNPFILATDISTKLMTVIEERENDLSGVQIDVVPVREYVDSTLAPHIIGTVGKIYANEWSELKEKGYSYSDKVGKSGIEKLYEEYLKGTDGKISYEIDASGKIISSKISKDPVQGNTLVLSLDKNLQLMTQIKLAEMVEEHNSRGGEITGSSAVAIDIKTGNVLVAANYPSYDINDYLNNYENLANDIKGNPLFNRAFNGAYQPGSCFKPLVACAALQTGALKVDDQIKCVKKYTFFSDYQPNCMGYHGSVNIITALSKSCNYYFFESGRRLGIAKMNEYCKAFGLGQITGVGTGLNGTVLQGLESKGILAGPEYRKANNMVWNPGDTIQAAIGQSDNMFTPLQLAVYTATIANNGVRYKSNLLREIKSYDMKSTLINYEPQILDDAKIDQWIFNKVKEGMLSVSEEGTASTYFKNYSIKVAGKTGTAETVGLDHSVFTAFAPYDDPQIAVAVVTEHGRYSTTTGTICKAIFDNYFFNTTPPYVESPVNTVLP